MGDVVYLNPKATDDVDEYFEDHEPEQADYQFEDHDSVWLCRPMTDDAKANLDQACERDDAPFNIRWGSAMVIDPRHIADVFISLNEQGWVCALEHAGIIDIKENSDEDV
jgi:hypothetical protein